MPATAQSDDTTTHALPDIVELEKREEDRVQKAKADFQKVEEKLRRKLAEETEKQEHALRDAATTMVQNFEQEETARLEKESKKETEKQCDALKKAAEGRMAGVVENLTKHVLNASFIQN